MPNMFQMARQAMEMRAQAKKMQKMLTEMTVDYENAGVKVTVNGDMQILSLELSDEAYADRKRLYRTLQENINKAFRMMKEKSAKELAGQAEALKGLFGGQA